MCGYTYTVLGELKIYSRTIRSAMCLPEEERLVLLFILDRTVGWHRVWETISPSQFADGVSRRGLVVGRGTGLRSAEVDDALQHLQTLGAIRVERHGRAIAYKVDEYWLHPDLQGYGMWELNEGDFEYEQ